MRLLPTFFAKFRWAVLVMAVKTLGYGSLHLQANFLFGLPTSWSEIRWVIIPPLRLHRGMKTYGLNCGQWRPRIILFLWRLLSGALPTRDALSKRLPYIDDLCPLCGAEKETSEHLFRYCPFATAIWFWSPLTLDTRTNQSLVMKEWVRNWLIDTKDASCFNLVAIIMWQIWKARCSTIL